MSFLEGAKSVTYMCFCRPWSDAILVQLYLALPHIAPLLRKFSVIGRKAVSYKGASKVISP